MCVCVCFCICAYPTDFPKFPISRRWTLYLFHRQTWELKIKETAKQKEIWKTEQHYGRPRGNKQSLQPWMLTSLGNKCHCLGISVAWHLPTGVSIQGWTIAHNSSPFPCEGLKIKRSDSDLDFDHLRNWNYLFILFPARMLPSILSFTERQKLCLFLPQVL